MKKDEYMESTFKKVLSIFDALLENDELPYILGLQYTDPPYFQECNFYFCSKAQDNIQKRTYTTIAEFNDKLIITLKYHLRCVTSILDKELNNEPTRTNIILNVKNNNLKSLQYLLSNMLDLYEHVGETHQYDPWSKSNFIYLDFYIYYMQIYTIKSMEYITKHKTDPKFIYKVLLNCYTKHSDYKNSSTNANFVLRTITFFHKCKLYAHVHFKFLQKNPPAIAFVGSNVHCKSYGFPSKVHEF